MKKCKFLFFQLAGLMMWPFCLRAANPGIPKWYGNDHYKITRENDLVKVNMDKMPWESFSVATGELVSAEGFLSLEVKALQDIILRVDGYTSDKQQVILLNEKITPGKFQQLHYNLPASNVKIDHLIFYINPGQTFKGEVLFKGEEASFAAREAITIYPNPTGNMVNIALPHDGFKQILIYDSQGKLILTKPTSGLYSEVNLAGIPAGVYIIKAKGGNAVLSSRLVVK